MSKVFYVGDFAQSYTLHDESRNLYKKKHALTGHSRIDWVINVLLCLLYMHLPVQALTKDLQSADAEMEFAG